MRLAKQLQDPQILQFCAETVDQMDGKAELELSPNLPSGLASSSTFVGSPETEKSFEWRKRSVDSITSDSISPANREMSRDKRVPSFPVGPLDDVPMGKLVSGLGRQETSSTASVTKPSQHEIKNLPIRKIQSSSSMVSHRAIQKREVEKDKESCLQGCACKCHAQSYQWPEGLSAKAGRLFYESNPRFTRRCSDARCRAGKIRSKITFVYPSSMVKNVVSFLMLSKGFKVKFQLKTQRLQPPLAPVIQSVLAGDLKGVKRSIEAGDATPSDILSDGWTLTHTAAYWGHLEIVNYLLKMGADTTIGEVGARTASDFAKIRSLHIASTARQQALAAEFPNSVDFKINFEFTPIHVAVLDEYDSDDLERPALNELLEFVDQANNAPAGEDWAAWRRKYRQRSPLYCDIIETFRLAGSKSKKSEKIIVHLKDQPDAQGWTPFLWAAYTGRVKHLETLIRYGADPFTISPKGRSALHQAAESKSADVMKFVLAIPPWEEESLDINHPDYWGETPLHIAASGSVACAQLLLQKGAKRDALQVENQTPLHYAAYASETERLRMVELLSEDCGSHIKAVDDDGCTAAFYYVEDVGCLKLLAQRGADLTDLDPTGKTLIHHACIKDQPESLRFLIQAMGKAHATVRDRSGVAPMAHALQNGSASCAKLLLDEELHEGTHGSDGWHLIHHAARIGDLEFLKAVVGHKTFRRCRKTDDGKTSAEVAMRAGTWKGIVKELLLQHDTKVPPPPTTYDGHPDGPDDDRVKAAEGDTAQ